MNTPYVKDWSLLEIYDQIGILIAVTSDGKVAEESRFVDEPSEHFSWYLDGELRLSYEANGRVLYNKMPDLYVVEYLSSLLEKE